MTSTRAILPCAMMIALRSTLSCRRRKKSSSDMNVESIMVASLKSMMTCSRTFNTVSEPPEDFRVTRYLDLFGETKRRCRLVHEFPVVAAGYCRLSKVLPPRRGSSLYAH